MRDSRNHVKIVYSVLTGDSFHLWEQIKLIAFSLESCTLIEFIHSFKSAFFSNITADYTHHRYDSTA